MLKRRKWVCLQHEMRSARLVRLQRFSEHVLESHATPWACLHMRAASIECLSTSTSREGTCCRRQSIFKTMLPINQQIILILPSPGTENCRGRSARNGRPKAYTINCLSLCRGCTASKNLDISKLDCECTVWTARAPRGVPHGSDHPCMFTREPDG